jgi:hypothetical protein
VSGNRFVAAGRHPDLALYAPAAAPLSARRASDLSAAQTLDVRRRERVGCDLEPDARLSVYDVASSGATGQALYTSKPLSGQARAGLDVVPLSPEDIDGVVRLLGWNASARVRRHEAVAAVGGTFFYSLHRRYDAVSGVLRQEALALHDRVGRLIAHQVVTLREGELCDGCALPDLTEGTSFRYRVRNVFELPGFPYPLLLLDTSSVEGRALSLETFTDTGRHAEFRLAEYVVTCAAEN